MKQVVTQKKVFGKEGEEKVAAYLKKLGFTIREHNFFSKYGEIDLIASKKELLVFVEVKTRKTKDHLLHDIITYSKQQKMIKTASYYCSTLSSEYAIRFDVAFVHENEIEYIEGAFTPSIW